MTVLGTSSCVLLQYYEPAVCEKSTLALEKWQQQSALAYSLNVSHRISMMFCLEASLQTQSPECIQRKLREQSSAIDRPVTCTESAVHLAQLPSADSLLNRSLIACLIAAKLQFAHGARSNAAVVPVGFDLAVCNIFAESCEQDLLEVMLGA